MILWASALYVERGRRAFPTGVFGTTRERRREAWGGGWFWGRSRGKVCVAVRMLRLRVRTISWTCAGTNRQERAGEKDE